MNKAIKILEREKKITDKDVDRLERDLKYNRNKLIPRQEQEHRLFLLKKDKEEIDEAIKILQSNAAP